MRHSALQTRIVRAIIIGLSAAVCLLLAGELASAATAFANPGTSASQPLVVSVPHRLSRWEALRRVKSGLESIKANYGFLFAMQEETWTGYHLNFRVNVLGTRSLCLPSNLTVVACAPLSPASSANVTREPTSRWENASSSTLLRWK